MCRYSSELFILQVEYPISKMLGQNVFQILEIFRFGDILIDFISLACLVQRSGTLNALISEMSIISTQTFSKVKPFWFQTFILGIKDLAKILTCLYEGCSARMK